MLAEVLLVFATVPSSLLLPIVQESWPIVFNNRFAQLAWLTVSGVLQAALIFWSSSLMTRKKDNPLFRG